MVYLHWGEENSAVVTDEQKALALALSRAGAAAVVGTHTHRLQGAGWLGPTYVAYGLSNFIWYHGREGETGLLDLSVRDGRVVADGWRPAVIPREGGLPRFQTGTSAVWATAVWRGASARGGSGGGRPSAAGARAAHVHLLGQPHQRGDSTADGEQLPAGLPRSPRETCATCA